jgi:hypothetical protein
MIFQIAQFYPILNVIVLKIGKFKVLKKLNFIKDFLYSQLIDDEIQMDIKLKNNTQLKLSIFNILGQSDKSDIYLVKYNQTNTSKPLSSLTIVLII